MGKIGLKQSTIAYDGSNSINDIVKEYQAYLKILSPVDLKKEFQNIKHEWQSNPSIYNVERFEKAKERMMELGFISGDFAKNNINENLREM